MEQNNSASIHIVFVNVKSPEWTNCGNSPIARLLDDLKARGGKIFYFGDKEMVEADDEFQLKDLTYFLSTTRSRGSWIFVYANAATKNIYTGLIGEINRMVDIVRRHYHWYFLYDDPNDLSNGKADRLYETILDIRKQEPVATEERARQSPVINNNQQPPKESKMLLLEKVVLVLGEHAQNMVRKHRVSIECRLGGNFKIYCAKSSIGEFTYPVEDTLNGFSLMAQSISDGSDETEKMYFIYTSEPTGSGTRTNNLTRVMHSTTVCHEARLVIANQGVDEDHRQNYHSINNLVDVVDQAVQERQASITNQQPEEAPAMKNKQWMIENSAAEIVSILVRMEAIGGTVANEVKRRLNNVERTLRLHIQESTKNQSIQEAKTSLNYHELSAYIGQAISILGCEKGEKSVFDPSAVVKSLQPYADKLFNMAAQQRMTSAQKDKSPEQPDPQQIPPAAGVEELAEQMQRGMQDLTELVTNEMARIQGQITQFAPAELPEGLSQKVMAVRVLEIHNMLSNYSRGVGPFIPANNKEVNHHFQDMGHKLNHILTCLKNQQTNPLFPPVYNPPTFGPIPGQNGGMWSANQTGPLPGNPFAHIGGQPPQQPHMPLGQPYGAPSFDGGLLNGGFGQLSSFTPQPFDGVIVIHAAGKQLAQRVKMCYDDMAVWFPNAMISDIEYGLDDVHRIKQRVREVLTPHAKRRQVHLVIQPTSPEHQIQGKMSIEICHELAQLGASPSLIFDFNMLKGFVLYNQLVNMAIYASAPQPKRCRF